MRAEVCRIELANRRSRYYSIPHRLSTAKTWFTMASWFTGGSHDAASFAFDGNIRAYYPAVPLQHDRLVY